VSGVAGKRPTLTCRVCSALAMHSTVHTADKEKERETHVHKTKQIPEDPSTTLHNVREMQNPKQSPVPLPTCKPAGTHAATSCCTLYLQAMCGAGSAHVSQHSSHAQSNPHHVVASSTTQKQHGFQFKSSEVTGRMLPQHDTARHPKAASAATARQQTATRALRSIPVQTKAPRTLPAHS
jgi:hypothetical protein